MKYEHRWIRRKLLQTHRCFYLLVLFRIRFLLFSTRFFFIRFFHLSSFLLVFRLLIFPEQLVQCFPQHTADSETKLDGRIVIALFYGIDRLPRHMNGIRQIFLRHIEQCSCRFQFKILHKSLLKFLLPFCSCSLLNR